MSLLRSEYLVALNDLIVACRDAAACHLRAARLIEDRALADELTALGKDREAIAEQLAAAMLTKDDIPNAPDSEKVLLDAVATRLKSALSRDDTLQLLHDSEVREDAVTEAARALLRRDDEDGLHEKVSALRDDATSRLSRLKQDYLSS